MCPTQSLLLAPAPFPRLSSLPWECSSSLLLKVPLLSPSFQEALEVFPWPAICHTSLYFWTSREDLWRSSQYEWLSGNAPSISAAATLESLENIPGFLMVILLETLSPLSYSFHLPHSGVGSVLCY